VDAPAGLAVRGGFACVGLPLGAVTRMVGSCVPSPAGASSAAGAVGGCPSPAEGDGADVAAAGAASAGCADGCGTGEGAVCANAPAQSDEIKNDVEASKRRRNATEAPCPDVGNFHYAVCTNRYKPAGSAN